MTCTNQAHLNANNEVMTMTELTGSCLCGAISYTGDTDIKMAVNCHCTDCQKITGSVLGTQLFVMEEALTISGEPKVFEHTADSGSRLSKLFCDKCGAQVFSRNSKREGVMGIRAGSIDQKDVIQPTINIFCTSAVPSTPIDPALKTFPKAAG